MSSAEINLDHLTEEALWFVGIGNLTRVTVAKPTHFRGPKLDGNERTKENVLAEVCGGQQFITEDMSTGYQLAYRFWNPTEKSEGTKEASKACSFSSMVDRLSEGVSPSGRPAKIGGSVFGWIIYEAEYKKGSAYSRIDELSQKLKINSVGRTYRKYMSPINKLVIKACSTNGLHMVTVKGNF